VAHSKRGAKLIVQSLGILVLSLAILASSAGYGQTQTQPIIPTALPIAINALGSCPDGRNDAFMKLSGLSANVPSSLDLRWAQLGRTRDASGQEVIVAKWQLYGPVPPTSSNDAGDVYFMVIDLDRNKNTGTTDGIFGLGPDLSVSVVYSGGSLVQSQFLLWPVGGGDNPVTLNVTPSIDSQKQIISVQIPLTALVTRFQGLGRALPFDNPLWGAYTARFVNSFDEEPAIDAYPERALHSTPLRPGLEFVDGQLLVRFKAGVTAAQAQAVITQLGTQIIQFFPRFGIYHLKIIDVTDTLTKIQQFKGRSEVDVAEINGIWCLLSAQDDPGFPAEWNLLNQGQSHPIAPQGERSGQAGADIGITRAWDAGHTDSSSVLIGVIDSGVDLNHPDLAANLRPDLGFDFIQNDAMPEDNIGHGTFVSSVIAAVGNNGIGLAGVSWKAALVPLKVADRVSILQKFVSAFMRLFGADPWSAFIAAMDRAIELKEKGNNLRVVNFSAGGPLKSDLLGNVIRQAGDSGILFVTAAGNDGQDLGAYPIYPCAYQQDSKKNPIENIICVAASTDDDQLASFSNYSASIVHLAAPSADVVGLIPGGLGTDSETLLGNAESGSVASLPTTAVSNGTSFAAPLVTGIAALLFASCPQTITVAEIKQAILDAAQRVPALEGKVITGGRLRWPETLPATCQGR
jgi:subtilisin family serine protease